MDNEKKLSKWRFIPNVISAIRIMMVGLFAYLFIKEQYLYALIVFIVASYTDVIDGFLARKYNWITTLGKALDPLADKLMLLTVFVCLYFSNLIPLWLFLPVIAKEILMIVFGTLLFFKNIVVPADSFGKFSSWLFAVSITLVLYKEAFPSVNLFNIEYYAMLVAALFALVTFAHYAVRLLATGKEKV